MTNRTASGCVSAANPEMAHDFFCAASELRPSPMRLPMRVGKVRQDDAQNCNCAPATDASGDIAAAVKSALNSWRESGRSLKTGRVAACELPAL